MFFGLIVDFNEHRVFVAAAGTTRTVTEIRTRRQKKKGQNFKVFCLETKSVSQNMLDWLTSLGIGTEYSCAIIKSVYKTMTDRLKSTSIEKH